MTRRIGFAAAILALVSLVRFGTPANAVASRPLQRDLITTEIDENRRVPLLGNTRPEANPHNDRGPVPDDFPLEHMLLQLRRPPELQQEFDTYLESLTSGKSPNFHKWLAPEEVGVNYGLSEFDLRQIERWLRLHGIRVNYVYPSRVVIDISARARDLHEAFAVEIHFLDVDGKRHYANVNDPEVPEALAPAIGGIVSMHDFKPRPMLKQFVKPAYNDPSGNLDVTPADLAVIYNFDPLFSQGITGAGQTIAIVEDTDPYTTTDWTTFRSEFQLDKYPGSLMVTHPNGAQNCVDPTPPNGDDGELALDIEYASAAAPGATITLATCTNLLIAILNEVSLNPHPYIISISYNGCEAAQGSATNMLIASTYSMAAMEGISVFVSSGDEGPASCDADQAVASHGINVGGLGSTPYNVSVGGTDFGDTVHNQNALYWSNTNSPSLQSALGYIREIPWNDSCAGILLVNFEDTALNKDENPPYGASGFCNVDGTDFQTTASGSGGPSGCATGTPSVRNEVSGSCAGYAKPVWQSGLFGNPNDGVRDVPDVSLFAANGLWGHFYVFCYTDPNFGGSPCTAAPDPANGSWSGAGGTSFAAPILAGIQALVNQRTAALTIPPPGTPGQGNPNVVYYAIAKTEYGAAGSATCNSSTQPLPRRGVATTCVFYDVTEGDIDLNCTNGSPNCFGGGAGGIQGVLVTGAISGLTFTGGAGYTSAPECAISAPHNSSAYNGYLGGVQATCTATINGSGVVNSVTLNAGGAGYAPIPICTLSGGGGSGATCTVTGVTKAAYQPSFPATPGWDFATGIGTINVYNLVFSTLWAEGP